MTYRGKFTLAIISAFVAFFALSGFVFQFMNTNAQQPINDASAQLRIFESVLKHIEDDYVDQPNLEKVRSGALKGLAYGLDPYSSYLSREQVADFEKQKGNIGTGIGAEFSQYSYLYVVSVIPGSPAEKAGIKVGDSIEYIGDQATRDISLYDSLQLIYGKSGTPVKLRVLRSGEKPQTISVVRGEFEIPAATAEMKDGVGVVKVISLKKGQAEVARNKIKELSKKGVKKIVLDLRNVAGGDMEEGALLANSFVKSGVLAKVVGKGKKVTKTIQADPSKFLFDGNVAVVTDISTADAAEVVAAALAENKRGTVVGERTLGAGSSQKLFTLRGGDGLLITTEKWASPNGKVFLAAKRADSGVKPEIEVKHPNTPAPIEDEDSPEEDEEEVEETRNENKNKPAPTEDIQLDKAIEFLNSKAKAASA